MQLQGKVAVITGGTQGLGLSITKELVSKGCIVHVIARNIDDSKIEDAKLHQADVSSYEDMVKVAKEIGSCNILINNAGVWLEGSIENNSVEDISKTIDINLKGVIYATKAFLSLMQKQDDGFIMNISSTSGLKGRDSQSVYAASKFGVTGFTESLKEDLKETGIKVAGFYPGGMNTKIFEKTGHPKANQEWMDTDKVARIIAFILEVDDSMILDHVVLNRRKK
jgi:NADP-dependent 3-hydroxy acid dehydrogenase YdfG